MVHHVLNPYRQPLRFNLDKLNLHFADVESTSVDEFFQLIHSLLDIEVAFHLKNVTQREVLNTPK